MEIKLHFSRVSMFRKLTSVWVAHTYKACNAADDVMIRHNGKVIGRTDFNPDSAQPRAYVEFFGAVNQENGQTFVDVDSDSDSYAHAGLAGGLGVGLGARVGVTT